MLEQSFPRMSWRSVCIAGVVLGGALVAAQAQVMPNDSDAWRTRCTQYLDGNTVPAADASGITFGRYEELARERSAHNQHFVACSLYLSAAGAESASGQNQAATNDVTLARIERKMALGQKLSFGDKMMRGSAIVAEAAKSPAPPNAMEAGAVMMSLTPGAGPAMVAGGPGMGGPAMGAGQPGGMTLGGGVDPGQAQGMGAGQPGGMTLGGGIDPAQGGAAGQPTGGGMTLGGGPAPAQGMDAAAQPGGLSAAGGSAPATNAAGNGGPGSGTRAARSQRGGTVRTTAAHGPAAPGGDAGGAPANAVAAGGPRGGAGANGLPPIGRYTCYAGGMTVISNGMGSSPLTIHTAGFNGYFFILDRAHYAGNEQKDAGAYVMRGNELLAQSGPYKRNPAQIHFIADGQYHRPTIYVQWLDDSGKPMSAGMICNHDGPPK